MNTKNLLPDSEKFNDELVLKQVERILHQPPFASSDILRRFLKYIINETLGGRADQIKEYTIAVYVLNKPATFRPLNDGIVRVHASRLRDALSTYYDDQREDDTCEITIPKGSYLPVFRSLRPGYSKPDVQVSTKHQPESEQKMRIAIMPFKTFDETNSRMAFADNIGQMLSSQFSHFPNSTVLSYYTTQQLQLKNRDIKGIVSDYGIHYVLAGNVHFESSRLRIVIQFINAGTEMLIWSDKYEYDIAMANLFEVEDLVVFQIMNSMAALGNQFIMPVAEVIELKGNQRVKKIASF